MKQVVEALEDLSSATTAEIVAHPAVDVGRRQVFDYLETLRDRGVLSRDQDTGDGRSVRWTDDGVCRVNDHGKVGLDPVELDALEDTDVAELAHSSIYTWEFRNSTVDDGTEPTEQRQSETTDTELVTDGGTGPPGGG